MSPVRRRQAAIAEYAFRWSSQRYVKAVTVPDKKADMSFGHGALADANLIEPFDSDKLLAEIGKLERGETGSYPPRGRQLEH